MAVASAIVVRRHPTAVSESVGRDALKAIVVAAGVGRLGRRTQESSVTGTATSTSFAGVSYTVAISVRLVGVWCRNTVVIHIRNPIIILIRQRECVLAEHIVPNVVGDIEVRLVRIGDVAGVETTKPHLGSIVTRLESLAHGRPRKVEHCPCAHTAVDRRPCGKAVLRSLEKAATVADNPVIQAMESDDRYWPHRPACGGGGVERRRHRSRRGKNIRAFTSHSMGHETAVRQARDVDATMVDPTELTDPSNDGPQESRVIDVLRIRRPAAAIGIPRVTYSLWPDHDKPNLVRFLPEAG